MPSRCRSTECPSSATLQGYAFSCVIVSQCLLPHAMCNQSKDYSVLLTKCIPSWRTRKGLGPEGPPEPGEAIWNLSKEQWEAFESLEAGNNVMGCIL